MIVRRILPGRTPDGETGYPRGWPFDMPAVAQIMKRGLCFLTEVTFFVGENGSGKSTVIEGIAEAYGMDVRGGDAQRRWSSPLEKSVLGRELAIEREHPTSKKRGYFLRAETAHGFFEFVSGMESYGGDMLIEMSHGESFLAVLKRRFQGPGLYLMDEPDTPLSFTSTLQLIALIDDLRAQGAQIICSTHSPLITALPEATILEFGDVGIREVDWSDLELVNHWRRYLENPQSYLRHILARN